MIKNFLDSLQVILVALVLLSLTAYNFLALYHFFKEKTLSSTLLIEHILSFSLLWLSESVLIVFIVLCSIPIKFTPMTTFLIPAAGAIFIITLIATFYYFGRKRAFQKPLSIVMLSLNFGLAVVWFFKVPLFIAFQLSLFLYILTFLACTYFTYSTANKISLVRLYYFIFSCIILLLINLLRHSMPLGFYLTVNLAICLFLTVSFCLYYAEAFVSRAVVHNEDIKAKNSELLEAEKRIQYLAYTHPDTGLKNAHKLHVDLRNVSDDLTGICMLNIKNYKLLLTLTGYRESKAILEDISRALIQQLKNHEDIYHFSTDRFIILYRGAQSEFEVFINNILSVFWANTLCVIDLNPRIGATYVHDTSLNYDILIQELELASHVAKRETCHYSLYLPAMSTTLQTNLELESKLKDATRHNLWEVYFQPKVNVLNNQIIGAEALIRWRGNETTITPNVFIPLAEKLGLISEIGRYVIDTTFEYVNKLDQLGFRGLRFSINLSVQQLMELDLVEYIQKSAARYNVNPESIMFEITESIFIHNMVKVNNTIIQLKNLGYKFSLDDFGTGYSSLAYLSKLNFDELKFDREFIKNIQSEEKNLVILECVTKMGQNLGLEIVTEGIEDELQYNTIKSLGCNYYQGYFYSKPIPFNSFLNLLGISAL